jgi:hypothetical protein
VGLYLVYVLSYFQSPAVLILSLSAVVSVVK